MTVPNSKALPQDLADAIEPYAPFGDIFPPKVNPANQATDGRTAGLRYLRQYMAALTFYRPGEVDTTTGKPGDPIAYSIPPERIFIEWPEDESAVLMPAVVFLSVTQATYDAIGLTNYIDESTVDVYQKGTVIMWQNEHVENIVLEVWADTRPLRRSLVAGIETALSPTEEAYGLRFRMANYYGQTVCFSVMSKELVDDPDGARGRRRARFTIEMRFNIVALVNSITFKPQALLTEIGPNVDV